MQFRRFDEAINGDIEELEHSYPSGALFQPMHRNSVGGQVVPEAIRLLVGPTEVVHHRSIVVPVLPLLPHLQPPSQHHVLGSFRVVYRHIRGSNPLH